MTVTFPHGCVRVCVCVCVSHLRAGTKGEVCRCVGGEVARTVQWAGSWKKIQKDLFIYVRSQMIR